MTDVLREAAQALLTDQVAEWLMEHRAWDTTDVVELREALRAALAADDTTPEPKPLAYARFVEREQPAPGPERVVLHAYTGQENLHIDGEYALYRRTERVVTTGDPEAAAPETE